MTFGKAAVIGTTVLIAAMDGGLSLLISAIATGGGTYVLTRRTMNRLPERIQAEQIKLLEGKVRLAVKDKISDDDLKALKKQVADDIDKFKKVTEEKRGGNKEIAAVAGIAAFACPALGLVAIAGLTAPMWVPALDQLVNKVPAYRERQQATNLVFTDILASLSR